MQCFEVDFNRGWGNLFTVIWMDPNDPDRMRDEDFPKVGDAVFAYTGEFKTGNPNWNHDYWDVGVGFPVRVKSLKKSVQNDTAMIIHFEEISDEDLG